MIDSQGRHWRESTECAVCSPAQADRIKFLESLLREIEEHPHNSEAYCYSVGKHKHHADGHRCCAEIAKRAREI